MLNYAYVDVLSLLFHSTNICVVKCVVFPYKESKDSPNQKKRSQLTKCTSSLLPEYSKIKQKSVFYAYTFLLSSTNSFYYAGISTIYTVSCPSQLTFEIQHTPISNMPNSNNRDMPRDSEMSTFDRQHRCISYILP